MRCAAGLNLEEIDGGGILKELTALCAETASLCPNGCWRTARHQTPRGQAYPVRGAQGALLDVDHGTYPYVHLVQPLVAAQAATGTGMGPGAVG